jgi:error-prone DNA polymerase
VVRSTWETRLETARSSDAKNENEPSDPSLRPPALRLGLRQLQEMRRDRVLAMLEERQRQPFISMDDFKERAGFNKDELRALAEIGALNCLAAHRRAALWETERTIRREELLGASDDETSSPVTGSSSHDDREPAPLAPMNPVERLRADYAGLRLTTGPHPMELLRPQLPGVWRAQDLKQVQTGDIVRVAGQVICRQRPGTAKGVCFVSLEDETGISNIIVWPDLFESDRLKITAEPFLLIEGTAQAKHGTVHIVARSIERLDFSGLQLASSHDFS